MIFFSSWLRLLVKGFLNVAFRLYYRSIRVQGIEHLPDQGPLLLVANHPNSLLDPAMLIHLLPRPIHFGAKHTLFSGPMRPILKAFGVIPLVRAQDERRAVRRNLEAFSRYEALLRDGCIAAIFPEGVSQDDPHLAPVKRGAARIALQAESAADFSLGLALVPVGLQFEPRRRFRADVLVRFGEPFTISDLAARYVESPGEAVRELTDRIDKALKRVTFHVESMERVPFVERLTEVYFTRARKTGIAGVEGGGLRGELLHRTAACLNHYLQADPAAVQKVERLLQRYERLREKAGIERRLLEEPSHLLPMPLAPIQAAAEAILGAIPALFGFLTGAIPYYLTKKFTRRYTSEHAPSLSSAHVLAGAVAFPIAYGLELAWVWRHFSDVATVAFAILLVPCGLFARVYVRRLRKLAAHLGGRIAGWMKLEAVARVRQARDDLLVQLDHIRDRYRAEVLGWPPLALGRGVSRRVLIAILLLILTALALFVVQLRDRKVIGLPAAPSPWHQLREEDPAVVSERLQRDARGAVAAIFELDRLEQRMSELRESFSRGERSYYAQEDEDEIHRLLLTYLNLRTVLLRTIWNYRGAHDEPTEGQREAQAFLLAYASAATLLQKAAVLVDTFVDDKTAQRKLNEGDLAWEIPDGTYETLLSSLSSAEVIAELQAATNHFDQLLQRGAYDSGSPWEALVEAAAAARPTIVGAAAQMGDRKLKLALQKVQGQVTDPLYRAQSLVSTWIGDFRLKERPLHRGLISPGQVNKLREILRPGDILLERRNWFLSNAFLPGFWPHTAFYLGKPEELEALGLTEDPRVETHWPPFLGRDAAGYPLVVIEAISEGVVFTSLEHSVGEADAVTVLRPRLTEAERRETIARAFSHYGKPYDFEFDFFSTDRLVCTELVYRACDGMLRLPLTNIMGRQTLPAMSFVQVYLETRGRDDRPFDLVYFLDMDEKGDRAIVASESAFVKTLERSRFTFLHRL